jgi:hypothetical protein
VGGKVVYAAAPYSALEDRRDGGGAK